MAQTSAQLKRKRESAAGLQKKAKKQRKSDAAAAGAEEAVVVADAVGSTADLEATPLAKDKSKTKSTGRAVEAQKDVVESASKQSKKQRKQEQKNGKPPKEEAARTELANVRHSSPAKKQKHTHKSLPPTWTVSQAQGGWFLPTDPIFSQDEKYILLANPRGLHVYDAETSLLAHFLAASNTGPVTAHALSSTNAAQVYVADSNGLITLWDWVTGTKVGRWVIGTTVRNMVVVTSPGSNEDFVYCHEAGNKHIVNVHALRTKAQATETELKRVLKTDSAITSLQVLLQGKYVVIATRESITIGKRLKVSKTALQEFDYVWRDLKFSHRITTCSTYIRRREAPENGKKPAHDQKDVLDLAVGDEEGVILLFEDILATFTAIEKSQKGSKSGTDDAESLRPKKLHWHRSAVGAVAWSLDGNYLISGGDETVLTIWQLATGKPQHLPHLTAAIENIVVSPSGSSYALALSNNSVIVISTSELDAKTNIIGIQTRRVDAEHKHAQLFALGPVPFAVDPSNPQQVLFTVPASQPQRNSNDDGIRPEPYLQTFDVANQRPVNRQALTRNNATDPNMAPDGQRVKEPNVVHMQVSHDGQWLATVDEWLPPHADTAYLDEGNPEVAAEEHLLRREVYLKMWRKDEKLGQWKLETRIDAPHLLEDVCGNGRVLDLVAHPKENSFATIGEDQIVRVWKPKTRLRNGIVVRGAEEQGLVTWSLHRSIPLPNPHKVWLSEASSGAQHTRTSRLTFSSDGSVIAAGVSGVSGVSGLDRGLVHLIDVDSGSIRRSMTEIDVTVLCALGIVGRHLVVVADCITVWDLVNDDVVYCASIKALGLSQAERAPIVRLATSEAGGTFAVSLPQFVKDPNSTRTGKKVSSKIAIYGTAHKEPLFSQTIPSTILGLVARKGQGKSGYIALDSLSRIRSIVPRTELLALPSLPVVEELELQDVEEMQDAEEIDEIEESSAHEALADFVLENEYDKPVVTLQDLEELFHNEGALQAPKDVFSAVVRLFGGVGKIAA
ncbi:NET1-associated nuclear protein 1 [Pleosporales sp. CAS-2024a]